MPWISGREWDRRWNDLARTLNRIEFRLISTQQAIQQQGAKEMAALDDLRVRVEEAEGTHASATVLIQELKRLLLEAIAAGDMGAVQALADRLNASEDALAAAVAANPLPGDGDPPPVE